MPSRLQHMNCNDHPIVHFNPIVQAWLEITSDLLVFFFPLAKGIRQSTTCDIHSTECQGCTSYDASHRELVLDSLSPCQHTVYAGKDDMVLDPPGSALWQAKHRVRSKQR
jgi:hypothetical protein